MKRYFSIAVLTFFAHAPLAYAQEHAAHSKHAISDLGNPAINFVIFLVIMTLLLRKPIRSAWMLRHDQIEEAVNRGRREMETAQAALAAAQVKLSQAPNDATTIRRDIAQSADLEARQIVRDAEVHSESIIRQAKESGAAELKATETAIRKELAETVVLRARERLRSETTAEADRARRRHVLSSLRAIVEQ